MGSGKSALGKQLAARLGCGFYDLDTMIEAGEGLSIPAIFRERGEASFRKIEAKYLRGTRSVERGVVATGGGTPCFFENMEWMNEEGVTIYLNASEETLFRRLQAASAGRPLVAGMAGQALKKSIKERLELRLPFYSSAQFVCDADAPLPSLLEGLAGYFKRFMD